MESILTIFKLKVILIMKDKLAFFWSLALPCVMLFINKDNVKSEYILVYWWLYMVTISYIYGVGLNALSEKDMGISSIIFSIKWIPVEYFFGLLLTQIVYSMVCLAIFNIVPAFVFGFDYFRLNMLSLYSLLVVLPLGFLGYNLTLLRNMYYTTISSICNMLIFIFFVLLGFDTVANKVNPFLIMGRVMEGLIQGKIDVYYIIGSVVCILITIPAIIYFKPLSKETR